MVFLIKISISVAGLFLFSISGVIPHLLDTGKSNLFLSGAGSLSGFGDKNIFSNGQEEVHENLQFQLSIPWEKAHLQVPELCLDSIKKQQFVGDNSCSFPSTQDVPWARCWC